MTAHRAGLLVVPLAVAALAGCGSAHGGGGTTSLPGTSSSTTETGTVRSPSASVRDQAARTCAADIATQTKLSAASRQALESICAAGAANSASAVHSEEAEACRALVSSTVPPSDRRAALAACAKP
jgi:hypothetical protein